MFTGLRTTARRSVVTALGLSVVMFALLSLPAMAAAKGAPISVEVGPIKTAKGYTVDAFVASCTGKKSDVGVTYAKGTRADSVEYSYDGTGVCTASASLTKATISVNLPKIAKLKLRVGSILKTRKAVSPKGCTGGKGTSREVVLRGSVQIVASKGLGEVHGHSVPGYISRISNLNCKLPKEPKATSFFGEFGQNLFLSADQPTKGLRTVSLEDSFKPAAGVTGLFFLNITGKAKLFNITSAGVATLTNVKPFAAGKLVLTELPQCLGSTATARNVSLAGSLTVNSPVLGKLMFSPATATSASIGTGGAFPADCNGIGSMPLTPAVDNDCSTDGVCSVQYMTNTDDFEDVSTLGTQTIVSETINFGDGTSGVFTNGSVSHTYATPGPYTATITIQTSDGVTQTTTSPVFIDS